MKAKTYDVAVVGATTLVGEAILDLLAKRKFPIGRAYALESKVDEDQQDVEFGLKSLDVDLLAEFDFSNVQLVFFATDAKTTATYIPKALAAGCTVVDDSAAHRMDDSVPLVVAGVNENALSTNAKLIANPGSNVTQLLAVLKPLDVVAQISRINLATYQSVSGSGREGVEELARQTAQLLNARPIEKGIYPKQIAFNLLPSIGEYHDNGYTSEEMKLVNESRKVLGRPDLAITATTVRVPVFFGHAQAVSIELQRPLSAQEARDILSNCPNIVVMEASEKNSFPTPVTEAANEDRIYVGRLRNDISHENGLHLWIVADNVRCSAALNSVKIAEALINLQ